MPVVPLGSYLFDASHYVQSGCKTTSLASPSIVPRHYLCNSTVKYSSYILQYRNNATEEGRRSLGSPHCCYTNARIIDLASTSGSTKITVIGFGRTKEYEDQPHGYGSDSRLERRPFSCFCANFLCSCYKKALYGLCSHECMRLLVLWNASQSMCLGSKLLVVVIALLYSASP